MNITIPHPRTVLKKIRQIVKRDEFVLDVVVGIIVIVGIVTLAVIVISKFGGN